MQDGTDSCADGCARIIKLEEAVKNQGSDISDLKAAVDKHRGDIEGLMLGARERGVMLEVIDDKIDAMSADISRLADRESERRDRALSRFWQVLIGVVSGLILAAAGYAIFGKVI